MSVADDGPLVTRVGGEIRRWVEVEPLLFESVDGQDRLVFGKRDGRIHYLFGVNPATAYGRVVSSSVTVDRPPLRAFLGGILESTS